MCVCVSVCCVKGKSGLNTDTIYVEKKYMKGVFLCGGVFRWHIQDGRKLNRGAAGTEVYE